jgi:membrane protein implicated in regulation of membrane protease activity
MSYLFLAAFIAGLLLAVRLMFFGAERRKRAAAGGDGMPLRRSEPAGVAFLVMFGVAGYLLTRRGTLSGVLGAVVAAVLGVVWAALVARVAIAMARVKPEHDPDDPRYQLQGQVAVVTVPIPGGGEGEGTIAYVDRAGRRTCRARAIDGAPIAEDLEVCIERVENGIAYVERWDLVESRL